MRRPSIAYLTHQFPPEVGAGAARAAEFAQRWRSAGAAVTIVTGMPNRPQGQIHEAYRRRLFLQEDWNGIPVLRSWLFATPKPGFVPTVLNNLSFAMMTALHAAVKGNRFDLVIASSPPFFVHPAGALVSRIRHVPLVLEIRDLWPDYMVEMGVLKNRALAKWLFAWERYLLRRAAQVVVVTESFRTRVLEKGVAPERVVVVPNGVDTSRYFRRDEAVPISTLERESHDFIVGYLGNFGAGQGLEGVLEAAARVAVDDPEVRFVLAGDGTQKSRIVAMTRQLGLTNVTIHAHIPREQTRAFYNACDVCLVPLAPIPAFRDTIPSKIFEIMACERPVLASLDGEGARIVGKGQSGVVAAPGDPDDIARAVRRLKEMTIEDRCELGRRGREFVKRHYERNVLADRYLFGLAGINGFRLSQTDPPPE